MHTTHKHSVTAKHQHDIKWNKTTEWVRPRTKKTHICNIPHRNTIYIYIYIYITHRHTKIQWHFNIMIRSVLRVQICRQPVETFVLKCFEVHFGDFAQFLTKAPFSSSIFMINVGSMWNIQTHLTLWAFPNPFKGIFPNTFKGITWLCCSGTSWLHHPKSPGVFDGH